MPSRIPDKVSAVFVLQVDYDDLRFLKIDDKFVAKYELSIEILDGTDRIVERKYWTEEIIVEDFNETLSTLYGYVENTAFNLDPGFYNYVVQMTDTDSKELFSSRGNKIFSRYWRDGAGISDIVFTQTTEIDTTLDTLIPADELIKVDFNEGFSAQFRIFSADNQPVQLAWRIYDFLDDNEALHGDSTTFLPADLIIDIDIPFDGESYQPGVYLLRAVVYHSSGIKKEKLLRFTFTWINRPIESFDIELSLEQMKYIISTDDQSDIENMTDEEKRDFFINFWEDRDLTKDTEYNELMEEYFQRIEYANREFTIDNLPAWETDRGRIYCIYGRPDTRRTLNSLDAQVPPQELWLYYKADKRFVFVDHSRKGHFLLMSETNISR
ncbi:GWxTD domain-containing protein [candidate division KSB1 bacterium]